MNDKFGKIKLNTPISLIAHGGSALGFQLAKTLIEQGGRVIIVDQYNSRNKEYVSQLKKLGSADFIDFNGLDNLYKSLGRVDYVFYLLNDYLNSQESFTSKDFLEQSNYLNTTLKTAQKHNAKATLLTSQFLNQQLSAYMYTSNSNTPSPYSALELQKYCETLCAEFRDKSKLNIRIVRMATVLGAGVANISDPIVKELIDGSVNKGELVINGEGLDLHYLINISDAVYGILKLTFSEQTEGEVISLSNNNDYTTLSIAYKLLEINPENTQIRFEQSIRNNNTLNLDHYVPAPNASTYGWEQKIDIEQTLIETISELFPKSAVRILESPRKNRELEQIEVENKISSTTIKTPLGNLLEKILKPFSKFTLLVKDSGNRIKGSYNSKKIPMYTLLAVTIAVVGYFLVLPIISIIFGSTLTYLNVKSAMTHASSFDLENTSKKLQSVENNVEKISKGFNNLEWLFTITNSTELFNNTSQLLFGTQYGISGAKEMSSALVPLGQYISEFEPAISFQSDKPATNREYREQLDLLSKNSSKIEKAAYNLSLATNLIDTVDSTKFPQFAQQYLVEMKEYNRTLNQSIEPLSQISRFLPTLLGKDSRQRYLILLQNPTELRSTGGWISSYAILALEGGQIRELKVDDVYNIDGQLKLKNGVYTPPLSMRNALGNTTWNLSLSNWDPDLKGTAESAEFFLKEYDPGTQINGLITIDTQFLKKLLDKWGGVEIAGESEKVTSSNLDSKIYQMHVDFTPGSTNKSTFLANLANETVKRLLSSDLQQYNDIASVIVESLDQKHMMMYFKDKTSDTYFTSMGWSGKLDNGYIGTPVAIDWNWGANKANAFLEKSNHLTIDVKDESTINYTYTVNVKNISTTRIYPQGDYENYMRIYLPQNAVVEKIEGVLDGKYTIYSEKGFKVLGGWFNTPINSTKTFTLTYSISKASTLAFPITTSDENITLDVKMFKQPGTIDDRLKVDITYPENWAAIKHEGLNRGINIVSAETAQATDMKYQVVWEYK